MTDEKKPFEVSWCYEALNQGEQELCNVLQIANPANVAPLHINIGNILEDESITINPINGASTPNEGHYHFKLQFSKVIDSQTVAVEGSNWLISPSSNADEEIIYLLWQGDPKTLSPGDNSSIEIILTGVATESDQSAVKINTTEVTIYWDIESDNYWDINPDKIDELIPPPSEYSTNTTLELDMVKATGQSNTNIPLYVGFVNGNKVLNTHEEVSSLQLRITNTTITENSNITFYYDALDSSNCSQLEVILEAEDNDHVDILAPWALGTEDQVNDIDISIHVAGDVDQWQEDRKEQILVGGETKGRKWTFIPPKEVVLQPQDTILIDITNIITAHPTGETNLYLGYHNVPNYDDGQFICQIEKAPLVYDDKVRIGKEQTAVFGTSEDVLQIDSNVDIGNPEQVNDPQTRMLRVYKSDSNSNIEIERGDQNNFLKLKAEDNHSRITFAKKLLIDKGDVGDTKLTINDDGNVGIGTQSPSAKLEVSGSFKVATDQEVQGIPIIDFQHHDFVASNQAHSTKEDYIEFQHTFNFVHPVIKAQAFIAGQRFYIVFNGEPCYPEDGLINDIGLTITKEISGNSVNTTVKCRFRTAPYYGYPFNCTISVIVIAIMGKSIHITPDAD
ncbi:MAG: hypothetical protein AB4038_15380 [Prochloraceae cyanobacterium]